MEIRVASAVRKIGIHLGGQRVDKVLTLQEIIGMVRRRFFVAGLILIAGFAVSLFYALSQPRAYQSTAVIQIEASAVTENLTESTNNAKALLQLQRIQQRLMSRDHLLGIVDRMHLFEDPDALTDAEKVAVMRESVEIAEVTNPSLAWRTDIVPTALTITVTLGEADTAAAVANAFVDSVVEQNRRAREDRVRDALNFYRSEEARVGGEIADLETEIAEFKRSFADSMPAAVAAMREQISGLKSADLVLEQQRIELTGGRSGDSTIVKNQVRKIDDQRAVIAARRDGLEAAIGAAPEVQKQFNALNRQLAQLEEQFRVITRHRAEAEMGLMLEASQQSENFEVLERAQVPAYPISPSRKKIALMGSFLTVLATIAAIYGLEAMHPVIRTSAQMERQLDIRPAVVIPNVETVTDQTRRLAMRLAVIAAIVIGLPAALWVIDAMIFPISSLTGFGWLNNG